MDRWTVLFLRWVVHAFTGGVVRVIFQSHLPNFIKSDQWNLQPANLPLLAHLRLSFPNSVLVHSQVKLVPIILVGSLSLFVPVSTVYSARISHCNAHPQFGPKPMCSGRRRHRVSAAKTASITAAASRTFRNSSTASTTPT